MSCHKDKNFARPAQKTEKSSSVTGPESSSEALFKAQTSKLSCSSDVMHLCLPGYQSVWNPSLTISCSCRCTSSRAVPPLAGGWGPGFRHKPRELHGTRWGTERAAGIWASLPGPKPNNRPSLQIYIQKKNKKVKSFPTMSLTPELLQTRLP